MSTAALYARALHESVVKHPEKGSQYLKNLREVLKRRGHESLMPRIAKEYERIEVAAERRALYQNVTPEMERTRMLLELYQKLTK